MALTIGTPDKDDGDPGMSTAIFAQLDEVLSAELKSAVAEAKPGAELALEAARDGWRNLALAVATGVIDHIVEEMEISGVTVAGTVIVPVAGDTDAAAPSSHTHTVSITPEVAVALTQHNDGKGRVR
ncbi:hypothetical protein [Rhodococcus sp. MTM3W5.2]|uniref:hypothetical protein n=1 Tax=Rhodococcus sp. MTM3W5.2 TaxID=1805827 RepID=UPI00097C4555|nr:hypothetical protein [Rhodococcus sp. MTM3W5.2]